MEFNNNQAIYIQSEALSQQELARANLVIRPQLGDISAIDLTRSPECIDAGILAARHAIPSIKRMGDRAGLCRCRHQRH